MNAPTEAGRVAPGIFVILQLRDEEFIPPDDSNPAAVTARIIINGLLAGKATIPIAGWNSLTEEQAAVEAIRYAWQIAGKRMARWKRGLEMWEAAS